MAKVTEGFGLTIKIEVSLDEAEIIESALEDEGEHHLSEHVKWCIQDAKRKAGLLLPAKGVNHGNNN